MPKHSLFKLIIVILAEIILLLLVFLFGMFIGMKKADFSHRFDENYGRLFGEPTMGFPRPSGSPMLFNNFPQNNYTDAFGNAGTVLKIENNSIIIATNNNVEKNILVSSSTIIREMTYVVGINKIHIGDQVVVIGSPGQGGEIDAKFIRVFPSVNSMPPEQGQAPTTSPVQ